MVWGEVPHNDISFKIILFSIHYQNIKKSKRSFLFPKSVNVKFSRGGGGHSLKNGVQGMYSPKDPFSQLLAIHKTPISTISVLKTLLFSPKFLEVFSSKASKLGRNLISKASNWAKFQFTRLHLTKKFSIGSQILQWSIHKPLCLALQPHTYTKMKVECLPPPPPN